MPGYGGGVGADTDGPNADYGEGMGTKGAAAADHSIGMGAGSSEREMSISAFRDAVARAMGVTAVTEQEAVSQAQTEAELDAIANARARSAAVEARDKTQREAREQQEREAMMAEIEAMQNKTNFATPATQAVPTEFDPQNPYDIEDPDVIDNKGWTLDESQFNEETDMTPAFDPGLMTPAYDPREVNKQVYGETDVVHNVPKGARGFEVVTETEKTSLPYSQMDEQERRSFWGKLNQIRQETRERQTPLGKALHAAFSTALNFSTVNTIGRAVKAALAKAGFNVNPNEVEQAARHAFEVSKVGPYGNRPDSFIEEFLNNLPASSYEEPWMKGLSERQIQYYLDRPEELKWVRNLWNQMNPMNPFFISPTN